MTRLPDRLVVVLLFNEVIFNEVILCVVMVVLVLIFNEVILCQLAIGAHMAKVVCAVDEPYGEQVFQIGDIFPATSSPCDLMQAVRPALTVSSSMSPWNSMSMSTDAVAHVGHVNGEAWDGLKDFAAHDDGLEGHVDAERALYNVHGEGGGVGARVRGDLDAKAVCEVERRDLDRDLAVEDDFLACEVCAAAQLLVKVENLAGAIAHGNGRWQGESEGWEEPHTCALSGGGDLKGGGP
eukprot:CAMPEP_0185191250 /NCGR_PEP_ID=MMETSP1140-20130426/14970_1 /TAXON_ID=298111 /ORGANISM="Pavlova sp., Strain CCMP459" /LENGTH=237 /DNA_ID=CAMNT_0027757943 /DNA_START=456 /DNA_END=1170 /DNA_ORIENTATION=-